MKLALRFLLFPFLLLFGATYCGCSAVQEEAKNVAHDVVDCTKATAVKAITEYAPAVEQVVVDAIDGHGKLDKDRVKAATVKFASDDARCVLASVVARLMKPPASSPDAPQASPLAVDLGDLQALHREQLGGLRYKLPDGGVL